jgi:hypothetical protein
MIETARANLAAALESVGVRVLAPTTAPMIDSDTAQIVTSRIVSHDTGCGWIVSCTVYLVVATTEPGAADDALDALADKALPALDRVTTAITATRATYRDTHPCYVVTCDVLTA